MQIRLWNRFIIYLKDTESKWDKGDGEHEKPAIRITGISSRNNEALMSFFRLIMSLGKYISATHPCQSSHMSNSKKHSTAQLRVAVQTVLRRYKKRGVVDDVRTKIQQRKEYIHIPDLRPKVEV